MTPPPPEGSTAPQSSRLTGPPSPPSRRKAGSSHTAYYPPAPATSPAQPRVPSPPPYDAALSDAPYREPQPVPASPTTSMPDLVEASTVGWEGANAMDPSWGKPISDDAWGSAQPTWETHPGDYSGWQNATSNDSDLSETRWWDRDAMAAGRPKPGRGLLPPAMHAKLIGVRSSIYKVSVTQPDLVPDVVARPRSPMQPLAPSSPGMSTSPSNSTVSASTSTSSIATHPPPTKEDVLTSVPHPYAQWSRSKYAWIYHQAGSSTRLPDVTLQPGSPPFPDSAVRKACVTCVDADDTTMQSQTISLTNFKTHHFHHYPKCVKGSTLSPPFTDKFASFRSRRSGRRGSTASVRGPDVEVLLDLYVCCQCQTYFITSGQEAVLPPVVDARRIRDFIKDRQDHPPLGKSPEESVVWALETLSR